MALKRTLGLWQLVFYGLSIILGAGIYALIGRAAGFAGNGLWISFIIAAFIALFTGFSYAELASMYPKEAAEYVYTKKAFKKNIFSFNVQWLMFTAGIIAVATVSMGFAGYFNILFGGSKIVIALLLISILSLINFYGIKNSMKFNIISTIISVTGLIFIIFIGFGIEKNVNYFEMPSGFVGLSIATALIFFAFVGFQGLSNISEESKDARKNVPRAMLVALAISTVVYILVSLSSINALGWEGLYQSSAPLKDVAATKMGQSASTFISVIALFATASTVMCILIGVSRIFYGISEEHSLPKIFSRIDKKRKTPYIAIIVVMVLSMLALMIGNIETVAMLSDLNVFIVFFFINLALIKLRYSTKTKRYFKSPLNIGKMPLLGLAGLASCVLMIFFILFYFIISRGQYIVILLEAMLLISGIIVFKIFNK